MIFHRHDLGDILGGRASGDLCFPHMIFKGFANGPAATVFAQVIHFKAQETGDRVDRQRIRIQLLNLQVEQSPAFMKNGVDPVPVAGGFCKGGMHRFQLGLSFLDLGDPFEVGLNADKLFSLRVAALVVRDGLDCGPLPDQFRFPQELLDHEILELDIPGFLNDLVLKGLRPSPGRNPVRIRFPSRFIPDQPSQPGHPPRLVAEIRNKPLRISIIIQGQPGAVARWTRLIRGAG